MADDFDLSKYITGPLSLREITSPGLKPVHPFEEPLSSFWKEDPLKVLGVVPFRERKQVPEDTIGTPIQEFYRGVNVFITGGLGFLGKVLVEKLLREIPHIGHIYILIREKRGKTCQERFQMLMEDKLFQRVKVEVPHYHKKITAVAGTISEPGLGLNEEDHQMLIDTVHVVFHCAADVRFLQSLRTAIESNVLGSKYVLDLAKLMTNLKSYMHVSTAYSQCVRRIVEESIPQMSINYKEIIKYVDSNTDSAIEDNLQSILQEWPNTYAFSKAMTEEMVLEESEGYPVCVFRPSIVANTYKEPVRGWADNLFGIAGILLAERLGILHHFRTDQTVGIDIVPVDYVVNCMIAASWNNSMKRDKPQTNVLNCALAHQNVVIWKQFIDLIMLHETWPFKNAVWYPSIVFSESHFLDEIFNFCVHNIQGIIMDTIAVLVGEKPRLAKAYSTINNMRSTLTYFTNHVWEFKNDNVLALWHSMTKEDKQLFNFNMTDIKMLEYCALGTLGIRYFYMKEPMESVTASKRKMKWLYLAHVTLKLAVGFVVLKLAVSVAHLLPF